MVGELRNPEAVNITLTAAECGKLVLATLHSNSAMQAIDRFVNLFPQMQHQQILGRLGTSLLGILTQSLIPRRNEKGRIAAFELVLGLPMIKGLITENRIHLIQSYMESGGETGMCTLDSSLAKLVIRKKIELSEARARAVSQSGFKKLIEQLSGEVVPS